MFFHDLQLFKHIEKLLYDAVAQEFPQFRGFRRLGQNNGNAICLVIPEITEADEPTAYRSAKLLAQLVVVARSVLKIQNTSSDVEDDSFREQVAVALLDDNSRRDRLAAATTTPTPNLRLIFSYNRNPDVVAERLSMANGHCELCRSSPFLTRAQKPYLEVLHITPLSAGGSDCVDNVRALCPTCHRQQHFGADIPILA